VCVVCECVRFLCFVWCVVRCVCLVSLCRCVCGTFLCVLCGGC